MHFLGGSANEIVLLQIYVELVQQLVIIFAVDFTSLLKVIGVVSNARIPKLTNLLADRSTFFGAQINSLIRLLLCLRCILVNLCFVGLWLSAVGQLCLQTIVSKHGTHLGNSFRYLSDHSKSSNTDTCDMTMGSAILCIYNLCSANDILWIFSVLSGEATSIRHHSYMCDHKMQ